MEAFHNDEKVKDKYLARVREHRKMDELVKGATGDGGKGCAVWCTLDSYEHSKYETELGIPEWLARVEDAIFEGLPNERAMSWPEEFLVAIPVGVDLEKVKTPFLIFILENTLESMRACEFDAEKFPDVKAALEGSEKAVLEMIRCHKEGSDQSAAWSAARSAAWSAARSAAWSAARSAAWSAESARSAAWSAAWSAARSAESAESAAWSAARSAAWSAESAAWSARSAAESAAYERYADHLLELLKHGGI